MSSKYAATAQRSLAAITRKGAVVSFGSHTGTPIFDPVTNTWSGGADVVATGRAVQTNNNLEQLVALGLVDNKTVTLLVAASGLTITPSTGMVMSWAGVDYSIDNVDTLAPDGTPILYTIVGSA